MEPTHRINSSITATAAHPGQSLLASAVATFGAFATSIADNAQSVSIAMLPVIELFPAVQLVKRQAGFARAERTFKSRAKQPDPQLKSDLRRYITKLPVTFSLFGLRCSQKSLRAGITSALAVTTTVVAARSLGLDLFGTAVFGGLTALNYRFFEQLSRFAENSHKDRVGKIYDDAFIVRPLQVAAKASRDVRVPDITPSGSDHSVWHSSETLPTLEDSQSEYLTPARPGKKAGQEPAWPVVYDGYWLRSQNSPQPPGGPAISSRTLTAR